MYRPPSVTLHHIQSTPPGSRLRPLRPLRSDWPMKDPIGGFSRWLTSVWKKVTLKTQKRLQATTSQMKVTFGRKSGCDPSAISLSQPSKHPNKTKKLISLLASAATRRELENKQRLDCTSTLRQTLIGSLSYCESHCGSRW